MVRPLPPTSELAFIPWHILRPCFSLSCSPETNKEECRTVSAGRSHRDALVSAPLLCLFSALLSHIQTCTHLHSHVMPMWAVTSCIYSFTFYFLSTFWIERVVFMNQSSFADHLEVYPCTPFCVDTHEHRCLFVFESSLAAACNSIISVRSMTALKKKQCLMTN